MKNWVANKNGTVTLFFNEGQVVVSKKDFDRAFGTMINSSYEDVKADYGI